MYDMIIREPDSCEVVHDEGTDKREDISISIEKKEELQILVTAKDTRLRFIKLRWNVKMPLSGMVLSDAWERGYGDMGWENLNPTNAMPWYFYIRKDTKMAAYGVKVRPNALCMWQADKRGITLWLDVRNGGEGVWLDGRTLIAASVVCDQYELTDKTSFEAATEFCKKMCTDPIFPLHPVYGANNWYYAYGHSSREEILKDTDYLMSMTKDAQNPPYMVIDDCWQLRRTDEYIGGPWVSNEKFGDMPSLIASIKEKGARPGIWMRFLLDNSEEIPCDWRLSTGYLDPSHPEVLNKIIDEVKRVCSWGIKLIKHDFTTFDIFGKWGFQMNPLMTESGWQFYDRTRTTAEIVQNLYRTILEAAKETDTLILGCNTIGHLGAGLMHMNRSGDDTSGKLWERTLRMGVNTLAFRLPQHRTFYDIDADCLGIMETLPWEQNRLWAKLLAKSGTSLFVSAKPGVLTEQEKEELAGYLLENSVQDSIAQPMDWEENMFPEVWKCKGDILEFPWDYGTGLCGIQGRGRTWDFAFLKETTDRLW